MNNIHEVNEKQKQLEKEQQQQKKRLECLDNGGHSWRFENYWFTARFSFVGYVYSFKCSFCGIEKEYIWEKLSIKQQNALKTLGILQDLGFKKITIDEHNNM